MSAGLVALANVLWGIFTIGGCAYLVFQLGHSGWWFVLAVMLWWGGMQSWERK